MNPEQELELLKLKAKGAANTDGSQPLPPNKYGDSYNDPEHYDYAGEARDQRHAEIDKDMASGHTQGVTLRAVAEGLAMPASLIANLGAMGVNTMTGSKLPMPSQKFSDYLTGVGVPEPKDEVERLTSALVSGGAGGALLGPGAIISGATGSVSGKLAEEVGAPGWVQLLASLAGGAAPSAAMALGNTAAGAFTTGKNLIKPFSKAGQEDIVGRTLNREATNPKAAIATMKNAPEFVPGSKPTAGVASKDPGMIGVERGLRVRKPEDFAAVDTANESARNKYLDEIAGQPEDIKAAKEARTAAGDVNRNAAFGAKTPTAPTKASAAISEVMASPNRKRDAVAKSMKWVEEKLKDTTDPEDLYAVRQDIADAIAGKFDSESPALKLASKELTKVRDALDADIEFGAPGYKNYLETFREDSKPIAQMETLQDIRMRSEKSVPNPITDERGLSQAKWNNLVNKKAADYEKTLTPEQTTRLKNIAADLDRGASLDSFKTNGSDTLRNITMSNVLGALVSGKTVNSPSMRTFSRVFQWMYKVPEEDMQKLLLESMKDPQIAANLMAKASPQVAEVLSRKLARNFKGMAKGAATGAAIDISKSQDNPKNQ